MPGWSCLNCCHGVATVERGEAGDVDVDDVGLAAGVLFEDVEDLTGDLLVALAERHDRVVAGVDIEGHERNPGVDGLGDHGLDRLGEPVVDDDGVGVVVDRLLQVQGVAVVVAVGTEEVERDAEGVGLGLGTGPPLLEVVTGRKLGDEGDVDAAVGELRRHLDGRRRRTCGGGRRRRVRRRGVGRAGLRRRAARTPSAATPATRRRDLRDDMGAPDSGLDGGHVPRIGAWAKGSGNGQRADLRFRRSRSAGRRDGRRRWCRSRGCARRWGRP